MRRWTINWNGLEKLAVYFSLIAYALLQVATNIPGLLDSSWFPPSAAISLLGIGVLGAIHYVIRTVERIAVGVAPNLSHAHFPEAFQEWIRPYKEITTLDVAAFTSALYYQIIQVTPVPIKRLRLLLFLDKNLEATCSNIHIAIPKTIERWNSLKSTGKIRRLEIKVLPFHTNVYFSVANDDRTLVGLLWPNPDLRDLRANEALVINRVSAPDCVDHLMRWFESMWVQAQSPAAEAAPNAGREE